MEQYLYYMLDAIEEDLTDEQIIDIVDSLSEEQYSEYHRVYSIKNLRHYVQIQRDWIETSKWFTGIHLHKKPTELEVLSEWECAKNAERFRVFYILRFPEYVDCRKNIDI